MANSYTVHVVNPCKGRVAVSEHDRSCPTPKKARAKKKKQRGAAARKATDMAKKKKKRSKRRKNPAPAMLAANPRRRRASGSGGRRRRRRRRNPEGGIVSRTSELALLPIGMLTKEVFPSLLGELVTAAVVRKWGTAWGSGILNGSGNSAYAGQSWGAWNYGLQVLSGWAGAQLLNRSGKREMARNFYRGAWEAAVRRFVWTEFIAQSPTLVGYFGSPVGMVRDDGMGNRWYATPQGWSAMQGLHGAGPYGDELVTSAAMGDELVGGGSYGHALPEADAITARRAEHLGTGYRSPYQAAYSYQG